MPSGRTDAQNGNGTTGRTAADDDVEHLLSLETFPKDWYFVSAEKSAKLEDTWSAKAGEHGQPAVLVCTGKPYGYLRTTKSYQNYELNLEWKFPHDENGNSGILIHTGDVDMVWPKSIQVQLHRPKAGSIFPANGEAKTLNKVEIMDLLPAVKDTWHKCKVTCIDGKVTVAIDEKQAGVVTGCDPEKGFIAFQSEGAEVHFRNILIKPL